MSTEAAIATISDYAHDLDAGRITTAQFVESVRAVLTRVGS